MQYNVRATILVATIPDLEHIDPVIDALDGDPTVLGPSLSFDMVERTASVLADVEADSLEEAEQIAQAALERALALADD